MWLQTIRRTSKGGPLSGGVMIINGITGGTLEKDASAASVLTTAEAEHNTPCNVTLSRTCALNLNTTVGGPRAATLKHFSSFVRA